MQQIRAAVRISWASSRRRLLRQASRMKAFVKQVNVDAASKRRDVQAIGFMPGSSLTVGTTAPR